MIRTRIDAPNWTIESMGVSGIDDLQRDLERFDRAARDAATTCAI